MPLHMQPAAAAPPYLSWPIWPLEKLTRNLQSVRRRTGSDPAPRCCYVLLTTGALNPVHRGHVAALHHVRRELAALNPERPVIAAFLSPSSDVYLDGKFGRTAGGATGALPGAVRYDACARALASDDFVDVGSYEVRFTRERGSHWPNFPEVCADLQRDLDAKATALWMLGDTAPPAAAAEPPLPTAAAPVPLLQVIYCCGSDHYIRCGLGRGVPVRSGRSVGVAVTMRAGDDHLSRQGHDTNDPSAPVYILPPLHGGPLAALSSTQIRAAMSTLLEAMEPNALAAVMEYLSTAQRH